MNIPLCSSDYEYSFIISQNNILRLLHGEHLRVSVTNTDYYISRALKVDVQK